MKQLQYRLIALMQDTPVSPGEDNLISRLTRLKNVVIVVWANRLSDSLQNFGRGRAVGKQVDNGETPELPLPSEAQAAPQGGIVLAVVGTAGIKHD